MKQNLADVDTMMFFDEVLEAHKNMLLTTMADAVSECRAASDQVGDLSREGRSGLLRLLEIWYAMCSISGTLPFFEGNPTQALANVMAQIYAYLILHPFHDPRGLALYMELQYMMDSLMLGEWFE